MQRRSRNPRSHRGRHARKGIQKPCAGASPQPPFIPNKDLPLSKDKIQAIHKEPAWKSGRVNEKEAWKQERRWGDYAIDEANNRKLGSGVDE